VISIQPKTNPVPILFRNKNQSNMYIPSGRSSTLLGGAVYLVATFLLASILHSSIIAASPIRANQ